MAASARRSSITYTMTSWVWSAGRPKRNNTCVFLRSRSCNFLSSHLSKILKPSTQRKSAFYFLFELQKATSSFGSRFSRERSKNTAKKFSFHPLEFSAVHSCIQGAVTGTKNTCTSEISLHVEQSALRKWSFQDYTRIHLEQKQVPS